MDYSLIRKTLFFIFTLLLSCYSPVYEIDYGKKVIGNERIAVLPFFVSNDIDTKRINYLSYTLPNLVYNEILKSEAGNIFFIPFKKSLESYESVVEKDADSSYEKRVLLVGEKIDVDSVVVGYVRQFEQRVGSEIGVTSPAKVDFEVVLKSLETQETLWSARFSESQLPLLYNIADAGKFIKRKAKWLTAEELTQEGIELIASRLAIFLRSN